MLHTAGHPVKHRKFGYRGVIVGTADHTCTMGARWIAQMGVDDLPRDRALPTNPPNPNPNPNTSPALALALTPTLNLSPI